MSAVSALPPKARRSISCSTCRATPTAPATLRAARRSTACLWPYRTVSAYGSKPATFASASAVAESSPPLRSTTAFFALMGVPSSSRPRVVSTFILIRHASGRNPSGAPKSSRSGLAARRRPSLRWLVWERDRRAPRVSRPGPVGRQPTKDDARWLTRKVRGRAATAATRIRRCSGSSCSAARRPSRAASSAASAARGGGRARTSASAATGRSSRSSRGRSSSTRKGGGSTSSRSRRPGSSRFRPATDRRSGRGRRCSWTG